MGAISSQITSLTVVYSTVYSDVDQRKYQSSALLAFVMGIHRGPVNFPHKLPVTRKVFPFDDVIMGPQGRPPVLSGNARGNTLRPRQYNHHFEVLVRIMLDVKQVTNYYLVIALVTALYTSLASMS